VKRGQLERKGKEKEREIEEEVGGDLSGGFERGDGQQAFDE
jgi:hypothetical protein